MDIITSYLSGFVDLLKLPYIIYRWLQLETFKEKMNVILLAGNSTEFLNLVLALITLLLIAGLIRPGFLRKTVYGLETFTGKIGHFACWFVLIMMIQQVLIIVVGQVFRGNEVVLAPLGLILINEELQWLSGQLKLYNAILIAMASAFTFVEGGHVRVDIIYSRLSYRAKKISDLLGTLIFLLPSSILLWWFSWPLATNSMFSQRPMNIFSTKASWRAFKWESSGTAEFTWVWSFKLLILVFAGLMIIQAVAFLLRNVLALRVREEIESHHRIDPIGEQDSTDPKATVEHLA